MRSIDEIDWTHWRAVDPATLIFIVDGDRILLIRKKRGLGAGKINGPGGKLDPGETALQCAIRECEEEVAVTPTGITYRGENLFQFVDGYSIHVHVFVANGYDGEPTETEEAVPLWFDIDAIPYDEMWDDDQIWLPLALSGQPFSARWIFDGEKIVDYTLDLKVNDYSLAVRPDD